MLYYYIKLKMTKDIKYCFKKFEPDYIIKKYRHDDIYTVVDELDSYKYVISYIAYTKSIKLRNFSKEYPYKFWCENNYPVCFMHPNIMGFAKDCLTSYMNAGDASVNLNIYKKHYEYNLINSNDVSVKNIIDTFYDF